MVDSDLGRKSSAGFFVKRRFPGSSTQGDPFPRDVASLDNLHKKTPAVVQRAFEDDGSKRLLA